MDSGGQTSPMCNKCGMEHFPGRYFPALGKKCYKCSKMNHFSLVCRSTAQNTKPRTTRVHTLEEEDYDDLFMGCLSTEMNDSEDWTVILCINGHNVKFKIDTGSDCNVISKHTYQVICGDLQLN